MFSTVLYMVVDAIGSMKTENSTEFTTLHSAERLNLLVGE